MRTKLPTLGVTFEPELLDRLAVTLRQPELVVRDRPLDMGAVAERRDAGGDRRASTR